MTSFLATDTRLRSLFLNGRARVQDVIELIDERRPALLAIDPLFRLLLLRSENGYAAAYAALGPFIDAAESTGSHILALHHSSKQNNRRDPIDLATGTIGFSGVVSTRLVMRRVGDTRTLQSVQRVGPDLPETILNLHKSSNTFALGAAREDFEEQE